MNDVVVVVAPIGVQILVGEENNIAFPGRPCRSLLMMRLSKKYSDPEMNIHIKEVLVKWELSEEAMGKWELLFCR